MQTHAWAQEVSLEWRNNFTRLARAQEASLERRTFTFLEKLRLGEKPKDSHFSLERKKFRSGKKTNYTRLARAQEASLERKDQNLGNNRLYQKTANLIQTRRTSPKTQIQIIKWRKQDIDNNIQSRNPSPEHNKGRGKTGIAIMRTMKVEEIGVRLRWNIILSPEVSLKNQFNSYFFNNIDYT